MQIVCIQSWNTSLDIDEFKELYITGGLRLKSDDTTRDSFWVGKIDTDGAFIWNYRYLAPSGGSIYGINFKCYRYLW